MKTLIIEDEASARFLMEHFMSEYGETILAEDGTVGFEKYKQAFQEGEPFDLICLDIMMPGLTGTDLLEKIRDFEDENSIAGWDRIKIIMTTALNSKEVIFDSFQKQCDGYLVKPLKKEKIKELLENLNIIK